MGSQPASLWPERRPSQERQPSPQRRPLLKGPAPPLSDAERLRMLEQAMRALAEQPGLSPQLRARGIAPLVAAHRRLRAQGQMR